MPEITSKMQLRAHIVKLLSKYRNNDTPSNKEFADDISFFKSIEDKKYIAKMLFNEIASSETASYIHACAIIALEALDKNTFEDFAIDFLQNKNNTDDKKFLVISLIKQKGIYFDYDNIDNYISNSEQVAQKGVQGFLLNAIEDPEVQMDLLDFYINIPKSEKFYLLNNLSKEDSSDVVAHAMSLLSQLNIEDDELDIIEEILLNQDSGYAKEGLEYILANHKINLKKRQKIKNKLAQLNDKYKDFKYTDIIDDSSVNDSLISFIDGNNGFALILSRKMSDGSIDSILVTINTKLGITGCMGFGNISDGNYETIKKRLFPDSIPVKISPIALKSFFNHYKAKNKKTQTPLPYELIVWEKLLYDIDTINYDLSEFINSKLDTLNLTEAKVRKFISSKLIETWFWSYGQNSAVDKLIDTIEENHITEYEKIEKLIKETVQKDFIKNSEFLTEIKDRLLIQSYVAHLAKLKFSSMVSYSLCFKNNFFDMLIEYLIDKSLYEYFSLCYEEILKQSVKSVFKRAKKTVFCEDELNILIAQIEGKWT